MVAPAGNGDEGDAGDLESDGAGLTQGLKVSSLLDAAASELSLLVASPKVADLDPPPFPGWPSSWCGNHMSEAEEENTIPEEME